MQRRERYEPADHLDQFVVDERRRRHHVTAVHHPMADRVDRLAEQPHRRDHLAQRSAVVDDLLDDPARQSLAVPESTSWYFTDELPELSTSTRIDASGPAGAHLDGGDRDRVDDVGDRRTTRQVVDRLVRDPASTGPTATASADRCTAL